MNSVTTLRAAMAVVEAAGADLAVVGVLLLLQTLEALVGTGTVLDGEFFDPAWVAPSVAGSLWIVRPRVLCRVVAGRWLSWTWMVGPDYAMLLVLAWSDPMPEPGGAESLGFGFARSTAVALLPHQEKIKKLSLHVGKNDLRR